MQHEDLVSRKIEHLQFELSDIINDLLGLHHQLSANDYKTIDSNYQKLNSLMQCQSKSLNGFFNKDFQ